MCAQGEDRRVHAQACCAHAHLEQREASCGIVTRGKGLYRRYDTHTKDVRMQKSSEWY